MMAELHDARLESLFAEAQHELEGEAITAQVMTRTRNRLFTLLGGGALLGLVVLLIGWYVFAGPLLEFALLVSEFLTNPLIDLGEGWLALVLMPINNLASIVVLTAKLSLVAWKKLTGSALIR
jgi:hypothetical protein